MIREEVAAVRSVRLPVTRVLRAQPLELAAGLGVCVIPRLGRDPLPRGVRIVAVRPTLRRHVYALWRAANTRRRAIGATVEAFRTASSVIAKVHPPIARNGVGKRTKENRKN